MILVVIAVLVVIGVLGAKRRKPAAPARPNAAPEAAGGTASIPTPAPMSDLESALSHVTDSTGRPIRDHIDAETDHVDELRVPDDTGPLLRRALDHVEKPADEATDDTTDDTTDGPDGTGNDRAGGGSDAPAH